MHWPSAHGEVIALLVVFKARKLCQDRLLATQVGDTFNFSVYKVNLVGNLSQCFYATFICDCRSSRCNFVNYYLLSRLNMKHICLILRNRFCVSLGRVDKSHSVNEQCFKLCRLRWYSWSMPVAINVDYLGRVNVSITFLMFFYDNKVSFGTITRF